MPLAPFFMENYRSLGIMYVSPFSQPVPSLATTSYLTRRVSPSTLGAERLYFIDLGLDANIKTGDASQGGAAVSDRRIRLHHTSNGRVTGFWGNTPRSTRQLSRKQDAKSTHRSYRLGGVV